MITLSDVTTPYSKCTTPYIIGLWRKSKSCDQKHGCQSEIFLSNVNFLVSLTRSVRCPFPLRQSGAANSCLVQPGPEQRVLFLNLKLPPPLSYNHCWQPSTAHTFPLKWESFLCSAFIATYSLGTPPLRLTLLVGKLGVLSIHQVGDKLPFYLTRITLLRNHFPLSYFAWASLLQLSKFYTLASKSLCTCAPIYIHVPAIHDSKIG